MGRVEERPQPWYAAGLYRRIQEARRWRPQRTPRKPWRQRLRERGLHWSVELVVGMFVAVVAVSLATVVIASGGTVHLPGGGGGSGAAAGAGAGAGVGDAGAGAGGAGLGATAPAATPDCIAAPIAGSTRRVCTWH